MCCVGARLPWGLLHGVDDVGQHRAIGWRGNLELQRAVLVHRAGEYLVAQAPVDGHALARDQRLVHCALTSYDLAIESEALTRPDTNDGADTYRLG